MEKTKKFLAMDDIRSNSETPLKKLSVRLQRIDLKWIQPLITDDSKSEESDKAGAQPNLLSNSESTPQIRQRTQIPSNESALDYIQEFDVKLKKYEDSEQNSDTSQTQTNETIREMIRNQNPVNDGASKREELNGFYDPNFAQSLSSAFLKTENRGPESEDEESIDELVFQQMDDSYNDSNDLLDGIDLDSEMESIFETQPNIWTFWAYFGVLVIIISIIVYVLRMPEKEWKSYLDFIEY